MKRFICLLLVLLLCSSMSLPAFADSSNAKENNISIETDTSNEQSRAEETEWVVRWYNGLIQRRLWSITYGYWLTDWETIGYYDP